MLHSPHLEPDAIRAAHARIPPAFRDSSHADPGRSGPVLLVITGSNT